MTQAKSKSFSLPEHKVKVEFIKKQRGNITNPKHVLFGGMGESAKRVLVPKRSKSTYRYEPILSKEEQGLLESLLFLEKNDLSVHKTKDNYWDTVTAELKKNGSEFDLSDPVEYIKFKLVLSYTNLVADSLDTLKLKNKATYRFVVVKPGDRSKVEVNTYNVKKEAYKIADKLETNINDMKDFLYLAGVKSVQKADVVWLTGRLATMVEEQPEHVVAIGSSTDYTTRALIARATLSGIIKEVGGRYQLEDGVNLAEEGDIASLPNAINFLSDPANSDIKMRIEAKIGK